MGDNYITRQQKKEDAIAQAAFESGFQKACDLLVLVLRDPFYTNGNVHGFKRIDRIYKGLTYYESVYRKAWTTDKEADVLQERLDDNIREVAGEHFEPFERRHPFVKQLTYKHGHKKWR